MSSTEADTNVSTSTEDDSIIRNIINYCRSIEFDDPIEITSNTIKQYIIKYKHLLQNEKITGTTIRIMMHHCGIRSTRGEKNKLINIQRLIQTVENDSINDNQHSNTTSSNSENDSKREINIIAQ